MYASLSPVAIGRDDAAAGRRSKKKLLAESVTELRSDPPSASEVRRRIEVAFDRAGWEDASVLAAIAGAAIQPLIDTLKAGRAAASECAGSVNAIQHTVRHAPPAQLRSRLLAILAELEPWNSEWNRRRSEGD